MQLNNTDSDQMPAASDFDHQCLPIFRRINRTPKKNPFNGPRREKTCCRGFRQSEIHTCSKYTYDTFQIVNNKGADQTMRMRGLVCVCVVLKPQKTGFLTSRPK